MDRASVSVARERVRAVAGALGFGNTEIERLALAVSELAQNQLDHARRGVVQLRTLERDGVPGIEVEARDRGPGIADLAGVLEGRVRGKGLGAGISTARRVAEELDADVRTAEGSVLRLRCFAGAVSRHPEAAVVGRGLTPPSGDHAVVQRRGDVVQLAVIDGAGHGEPARESAALAAAFLTFDGSLVEMVRAMHEGVRHSRGASATIARVDLRARTARVCGVGNVTLRVTAGDHTHTYRPTPGLLGSRRVEPSESRFDFPPRAVLYAFTDGISTRADVGDGAARSAIHIAQRLFADCAKDHDDALVAVLR